MTLYADQYIHDTSNDHLILSTNKQSISCSNGLSALWAISWACFSPLRSSWALLSPAFSNLSFLLLRLLSLSLYQSPPTPPPFLTQLYRALKDGYQHVSLKVTSSQIFIIDKPHINTVNIRFCYTCSLIKPELIWERQNDQKVREKV